MLGKFRFLRLLYWRTAIIIAMFISFGLALYFATIEGAKEWWDVFCYEIYVNWKSVKIYWKAVKDKIYQTTNKE